MHLKEVFSEDFLFSGTSNFTYSGLDRNIETNNFVKDNDLVQDRKDMFKQLLNFSDTLDA